MNDECIIVIINGINFRRDVIIYSHRDNIKEAKLNPIINH